MWRETKILLIDDNSERRRDLTVILNFLGEDHLVYDSQGWRDCVAQLDSSRGVLSVLLGEVKSKGGVLELLKQLALWDEFLPTLLVNEHVSAEWPQEQRRSVLASLEMPLSYNKLLDSLHRAQVYREMYDQARERGRQRETNLFRSLGGTSRAIQQVRQMMQQVAGLRRCDLSALSSSSFARPVFSDAYKRPPRIQRGGGGRGTGTNGSGVRGKRGEGG